MLCKFIYINHIYKSFVIKYEKEKDEAVYFWKVQAREKLSVGSTELKISRTIFPAPVNQREQVLTN